MKPNIIYVDLRLNKTDLNGNENTGSALDIDKFKKDVETQFHMKDKNREDSANETKELIGNTDESESPYRPFEPLRLRFHMKSNVQDSEAECEVCRTRFPNKNRLAKHVYFTHPECHENLTCDVCSKTFKQMHILKNHMMQAHPPITSVPAQLPQSHSTCNCECHTMALNLTTGIKQLDLKIDSMQRQLDIRIKSMEKQLSNISSALARISQTLLSPLLPVPPAHASSNPPTLESFPLPTEAITPNPSHSVQESKKVGRQCLLCGLFFTSNNTVRHFSRIHPSYLGGSGSDHPKYPESFCFRTNGPLKMCPRELRPPLEDLNEVENVNWKFLGVNSASSKSKTSARTKASNLRRREAGGKFK